MNEDSFLETLGDAIVDFEKQHGQQPDYIYINHLAFQKLAELHFGPGGYKTLYNPSTQRDELIKGIMGTVFGIPVRLTMKLEEQDKYEAVLGVCEVCKHKFKCLVGHMEKNDLFEHI